MIQPQTYLNVADNSGARKLMCIRVLGRNQNQVGSIGDVIIAVVKEALPNMQLKKSEIVSRLLSSINFSKKSVITIRQYGNLFLSRIRRGFLSPSC